MSSLSVRFSTALCAAAMAAYAFGAATPKPEPIVVDTSLASGHVVDQSTAYNGGNSYKAEHAFDGNWSSMSNCWIADLNSTNPVAYCVYEFNTATVVDGIRIHNSGDWGPEGRAPNTWTFEGSNDTNGTWTVLDSHSGEASWKANEIRTFGFANNDAYKYYRFRCTKCNGAQYVGIYEIEFLRGSIYDLTTATAGGIDSATAAYVYGGTTYGESHVFDNKKAFNDGRWIGTMPVGGAYVVYRFNNPTRVNGISLVTPNYGSQTLRAPKDWTFFGSNDGETWDLLDTQTGETAWSSGGEERFYKFTNTKSYQYY